MGQYITLGGDRLGAGKKNKVYLHNYERSTHDLSQTFTSSMGVGMLIPFMCVYATRDDKFEIDLSAGLRTIPSKAPLFGSFKLQLDVFECDARLYQALLHNNPLAIGLNANQVKFPKIRLTKEIAANTTEEVKTANNSLLKYLGLSGIGTCKNDTEYDQDIYRDFDATPFLAYYDIFKNYYANKQEENAYQIGHQQILDDEGGTSIEGAAIAGGGSLAYTIDNNNQTIQITQNTSLAGTLVLTIRKDNTSIEEVIKNLELEITTKSTQGETEYTNEGSIEALQEVTNANISVEKNPYDENLYSIRMNYKNNFNHNNTTISKIVILSFNTYRDEIKLLPFKLKEIDDMRMDILSFHSLGESYIIDTVNNVSDNETSNLDFAENAIGTSSTEPNFAKSLAGIVVKTYQNDIFNNWLRTEWIDGDNGINAITAISTSSGKIEIDAINFSEKLYNLLNRVAASDGTYYGYLNAAYTDSAKNFKETPIWLGGYSDEIIFEEIIQTAPTEGQPLGTLGGRGNLVGKHKGGKIVVKVDEPAYIIGIASITPRITYSQGNEWYMTEIDSLADVHVPALDGIGFENLLAERMHSGATIVKPEGVIEERQVVGKIPAWLNYMTAVDKSFGDFAADGSGDYMVLNRDYDCENGELKDATTYIDPAKFNYAFAYTKLDAQNFWVRIHSDIKARRLMSAKQIPSV